jgi:hypothetical protein
VKGEVVEAKPFSSRTSQRILKTPYSWPFCGYAYGREDTNMATMMKNSEYFQVVHPLDDVPEQKRDTSGLGRMDMSKSVQLSLLSLRGYLIVMAVITAYRVVSMAGALVHAPH